MQRLRIEHVTEYRFPYPVTLLEHRLRLRPREDHRLRISASQLIITPTAKLRWQRDPLDNSVAVTTFDVETDCLVITSTVDIDHFDEAPLDFVVEGYGVNHPFRYLPEDDRLLQAFFTPCWPEDQSALTDWLRVAGVLNAEQETFTLLDTINRAIHAGFRYEAREAEGVQSPSQTVARGVGSCRDFAALFVDACRHLGLASRFVSGYLHSPGATTSPMTGATHAWAEVYIPGPGWKGFDPTCGKLAGAEQIAVAVARDARSVPPVAGSFVAPSGCQPKLRVSVHVGAR